LHCPFASSIPLTQAHIRICVWKIPLSPWKINILFGEWKILTSSRKFLALDEGKIPLPSWEIIAFENGRPTSSKQKFINY
jgi:hypothetical protein